MATVKDKDGELETLGYSAPTCRSVAARHRLSRHTPARSSAAACCAYCLIRPPPEPLGVAQHQLGVASRLPLRLGQGSGSGLGVRGKGFGFRVRGFGFGLRVRGFGMGLGLGIGTRV